MARKSKKNNDISKCVIKEEHNLSRKSGGGKLVLEVWEDKFGNTSTYRLAYINGAIHSGDNGRVLGYDNAHGEHHRHYFGEYQVTDFESIEAVVERFECEWREISDEYCS